MLNREITIGSQYAEAVCRRGIAPLPPRGFQPNWQDQPSRFKIYQQVERFPLPAERAPIPRSMTEIVAAINAPQQPVSALTFEQFATMVHYAHGILNRRLGVNWNQDDRVRAIYHESRNSHGRGTASGGGMYPTEIYWVSGTSGPFLPGVYHYDNAHHAMERLFVGDATALVREAVFHHPAAQITDQFLLISLNFWKNAFKYTSFCYHVITEDLGALLGSLRFLAVGYGTELPILLWFADETLNAILGLETVDESVFAVIPLPVTPSLVQEQTDHVQLGRPLTHKTSFQRSKEVLRFPMNEQVHRSALIEDEPRPAAQKAFNADCDGLEASPTGDPIALPAPIQERFLQDLLEVFHRRQTSFGRFSRLKPLSQAELGTLLYLGAAGRNYLTDLKQSDGRPHYTRLIAFILNVEGLEPGAYSYDQQRHCLWPLHQGDLTQFLQDSYFLRNYNLAEVGALFTIVGRVDSMLDIYGNRGIRVLHAEVGIVAQSIYMGASALSIGCGAALGFNNVTINTFLGFDTTDQRTMLFLLIGHHRNGEAHFDYRLAW